jgi:hypothetical protein
LKESRIEQAQALLTTIGIKHMWVFQTRETGLANAKKVGKGNGNY